MGKVVAMEGSSKRVGRHIQTGPRERTHQTKIVAEPAMPCKNKDNRPVGKGRTDGLCDNCGHFADKGAKRGQAK
jgi:hypothetical protein